MRHVTYKKNTWTDDSAIIQFQDEKFLQAILENPRNTVDKNNDGQISEKEARTATVLDVSLAGISSMEEIKYFTSLTGLFCYGNRLTTLDVSRHASLRQFNCSNNLLENLDVSACSSLTILNINYNRISEIDFYANTLLEELYCEDNLLTLLDLRNNKELKYLSCSGNKLSRLILYRHHKLGKSTIAEIREEYGDIIDYEFARP